MIQGSSAALSGGDNVRELERCAIINKTQTPQTPYISKLSGSLTPLISYACYAPRTLSQPRLPQRPHLASFGAAILGLYNLVLHAPIMLQRAVAVAKDSCKVDIGIDTVLAGDKAVAAFVVEPFYYAPHTLNISLVLQR